MLTIEGLSVEGDHPVQRAWIEEDVSQCGYCQPGQIMAAVYLLQRVPSPTDEQIDEIFWPQSVVAFGLSAPRGIVRADGLLVDQQPVPPGPGTTLGEIMPRGFHLTVGAGAADGLNFDLPMVIRGSGSSLDEENSGLTLDESPGGRIAGGSVRFRGRRVPAMAEGLYSVTNWKGHPNFEIHVVPTTADRRGRMRYLATFAQLD